MEVVSEHKQLLKFFKNKKKHVAEDKLLLQNFYWTGTVLLSSCQTLSNSCYKIQDGHFMSLFQEHMNSS